MVVTSVRVVFAFLVVWVRIDDLVMLSRWGDVSCVLTWVISMYMLWVASCLILDSLVSVSRVSTFVVAMLECMCGDSLVFGVPMVCSNSIVGGIMVWLCSVMAPMVRQAGVLVPNTLVLVL